MAPGARHAHCSLPVPSLWAGLSPHLHFLFGVCFSQLQRGHPGGNHLSGSLWTKPNLFGGFVSSSLKAWQVQRNFLNCNFLTTFSKTHRLNLAWSLENIQAKAWLNLAWSSENIQAKACYVQTVSLSFKSTQKKRRKSWHSVLQTAQCWLSDSTPWPLLPPPFLRGVPWYNMFRDFWEIYEEQVPWKSYLIILVCLFSLNQSNSSNKPRMSLQHHS